MARLLTRFAPTPSGYLHFGNAYSMVLTALLAAEQEADILLRIDDLDEARYRPRYARHIFKTLHYLGLSWQEGPENFEDFEANYRQRYRLDLYQDALQQLRRDGLLYACQCSRRQVASTLYQGGYAQTCREVGLDMAAEKMQWRFKTPFESEGLAGLYQPLPPQSFPAALRDVVLRRKNGLPAYQLASVIDDEHFGVELVVRGRDLLDSSLAQMSLARALDLQHYPRASFVHHPLIRDESGEKLSKSEGERSLYRFIESGGDRALLYHKISGLLKLPIATSFDELKESWLKQSRQRRKASLQ